ncbi:MAG TPA: IS481 family transposase, partial [Candidatus Dormibacteraeota bacterium]|nr:IS481 family transposase [Candidatus Dormibacteraeota bacterium]
EYYNQQRPHRSLADATPASRFQSGERRAGPESLPTNDYWVARKVASNGIVCVGYQKVNVGLRNAGSACDILVKDGLLQFWVGSELVKTEVRATQGVVRKKNAEGHAPRR